ncbi:MAG: hydroxyisourate hydrolase [Acidobacteria bacterium]|nr:hydroxyisourate hydrolase [Acidobacteriota bacterium]
MSAITTHVLDTSLGKPAAGVPVALERQESTGWKSLASAVTSADGRAGELLPPNAKLESGTYRLRFDTAAYFRARGVASFYPHVEITFHVKDAAQHYHVPLLLSPFGYSTYRGS